MQLLSDAEQEIALLRSHLLHDAQQAKLMNNTQCRQEWIDPMLWSQYMGKTGRRLYQSFSDEELLDILRTAAQELGHLPSQKEVFCVYRSYIRRRFTNWPTALRAAGLKAPKTKKQTAEEKQTCEL